MSRNKHVMSKNLLNSAERPTNNKNIFSLFYIVYSILSSNDALSCRHNDATALRSAHLFALAHRTGRAVVTWPQT